MAARSKSKARSSVERRLTKIQLGWSKEFSDRPNSKKGLPHYDRPDSKLKRAVYRLVRDCIEGGLLDVLKESAELQLRGRGQLKPSARNNDNPFFWGLTAACGADYKLPRPTKLRFVQELQYAHMHHVPPEFLIGFIHQIRPSGDLQERIDNAEMERWFVKRHRSAAAE